MVDCKDIAQTLLDCLKQTECMKSGGSAKECMAAADAPDCQVYRNTRTAGAGPRGRRASPEPVARRYFECKRSQLDMRTSIRGSKSH